MLQEPAEAEGSQRRRLLVPANEGDPTESKCFAPGDAAGMEGIGTGVLTAVPRGERALPEYSMLEAVGPVL